jgi:hypothetical protein
MKKNHVHEASPAADSVPPLKREYTPMLPRLQAADPKVPAGRVGQDRAFVLADRSAMGDRGVLGRK